MSASRTIRIAVDTGLAAIFVLMMATPVTYSVAHEWLGVVLLALLIFHIFLSRHHLASALRRRRPGDILNLILDLALLVCVLAQMASAVVLSEHVLAWAPAVEGAAWARIAHLLGAYWGFVLAAIHAGMHLRTTRIAGRLPNAANWTLRLIWLCALAFGCWSFVTLGYPRYMTLSLAFYMADPGTLLPFSILQNACIFAGIAGIAHYMRLAFSKLRPKIAKTQKESTLPDGSEGA